MPYVNSAVGSAVMLSGTYELEGEVSRRPLNALPPLLVLASDAWVSPLVGVLAEEIVKDDLGQEAVLDRLLIAVLRAWFARPDADAPGWYRAWGDPVVGKAPRLVHDDPTRQRTVADLAAEVGASRAAFARRFTERVGEPPMALPPTGGCHSPPTCCWSQTPRSARSPTRSAMRRRTRPAPRSSACAVSVPGSTGSPQPPPDRPPRRDRRSAPRRWCGTP